MTYRMIGQTVGQLWDKLQDKFVVDKDGLYYNQRLEAEIKKRQSFVESRKSNKAGVNQHTKNKRSHDLAMTSHMENENDNRNIISLEEDIRDRGVRGERRNTHLEGHEFDKACFPPHDPYTGAGGNIRGR